MTETESSNSETELSGSETEIYYVVIKEAVYMHGLGGIFRTFEEALQRAKERAEADTDRHHKWTVYRVGNDKFMSETGYGGCFSNKHGTCVMSILAYQTKQEEPADETD